jgi:hypothetical protein
MADDPQMMKRPAEQPKKPWDSVCDLQSLKVCFYIKHLAKFYRLKKKHLANSPLF